jgi:hypothetical protein
MGRLKTGTPPRLHRRSIDFSLFQPSTATTRRAVLVHVRPAGSESDRLPRVVFDRARARRGARPYRSIPLYNGKSAELGRDIARRSKTR